MRKGKTFLIRSGLKAVVFKDFEIDQSKFCIDAPNAMFFEKEKPIKREEEEKIDEVGYDDIWECRK